MDKAIELAARVGAGKPRSWLRCVETGEIATTVDWCERIGEKLGIKPATVRNNIWMAIRRGSPAYGLHFERHEEGGAS